MEILPRNVKKENDEQYKGGWPVSADARRLLYLKYAKYPEDVARQRGERINSTEIRDMWSEVADTLLDNLGDTRDKTGIDVGSSSGYFINTLLERGYRGSILGVDLETGPQEFLEWDLSSRYPDVTVRFGGSNAQSLREVKVIDFENNQIDKYKLGENEFDFLTELFVLYHVPDVKKAYNAAHRVLKPGGMAIFSGRGTRNQLHLWTLGAITSQHFDSKLPESFYTHHSVEDMKVYLSESPKFELLKIVPQADHLWIPATEEGWEDYKMALMSLGPMMKDKLTGRPIHGPRLQKFLDDTIRPDYFETQAAANHGYFVDYVFQSFFVCRAVK